MEISFPLTLEITADKPVPPEVKLSKIIAKNKKNYYAFAKEAPELVIYQNLSIDAAKDMVTIGIVSKLTPRIINSFI